MTYNIHPIFVHFPIALLFLYSIIKILPIKKWFPNFAWVDIERILLLVGVFGAFAALATGDTAERLLRTNHQLVEVHSNFAAAATWFYGLLLLGEILYFITPILISKFNFSSIVRFLLFIKKILLNRVVSIVLALLGLITISITGLLGGVIVYGVTADPIAQTLLKILGISI